MGRLDFGFVRFPFFLLMLIVGILVQQLPSAGALKCIACGEYISDALGQEKCGDPLPPPKACHENAQFCVTMVGSKDNGKQIIYNRGCVTANKKLSPEDADAMGVSVAYCEEDGCNDEMIMPPLTQEEEDAVREREDEASLSDPLDFADPVDPPVDPRPRPTTTEPPGAGPPTPDPGAGPPTPDPGAGPPTPDPGAGPGATDPPSATLDPGAGGGETELPGEGSQTEPADTVAGNRAPSFKNAVHVTILALVVTLVAKGL